MQSSNISEPVAAVPGELIVEATAGNNLRPSDLATLFQAAIREALGSDFRMIPPAGDREAQQTPVLFPGLDGTVRAFHLTAIEPTERAPEAARILNSSVDVFRRQGLGSPRVHWNWYSAAQPNCIGGSPGSYPVPFEPPKKRLLYQPTFPEFRADRVTEWGRQAIKIVVLDTCPPQLVQTNEQYIDLEPHFTIDPPSPGRNYRDVRLAVAGIGDMTPIEGLPEHYAISEHGLFVSSVIHAVAPWADIQLIRVLNDDGVGSLDVLLKALADVLANTEPGAPLIVNLSLGMLPPVEQLPFILQQSEVLGVLGRPQPPGVQLTKELLELNPPEVETLLSLRPLIELLQRHNCLVVAAAGNDSVAAYTSRGPRWNPRASACYDRVLGVAATTRDSQGASYSNSGDIPVLGNGFAAFGGGAAPGGRDADMGVSGLFSAGAAGFPLHARNSSKPGLDSGWAQWSGTSFATPMMAGMVGNYWASTPQASSAPDAAAVLNALTHIVTIVHGQPDVADLNVPIVPVEEVWF